MSGTFNAITGWLLFASIALSGGAAIARAVILPRVLKDEGLSSEWLGGGAARIGSAAALVLPVALGLFFVRQLLEFRDPYAPWSEDARLLLTGTLPNEGMQAETVSMAWKTEGVKDVINEIQTGTSSLRDLAKDSWITTQLHSKITLDKKILAINYSIETVNRVIYMIGIAQNQTELDRVVAHAKNISYVKRIINHVRVKKGRT